MSNHETPPPEGGIIGHVVGSDSNSVTVCEACYDGGSIGGIRDNDAYGSKVPYPECYVCGEVMRPDE